MVVLEDKFLLRFKLLLIGAMAAVMASVMYAAEFNFSPGLIGTVVFLITLTILILSLKSKVIIDADFIRIRFMFIRNDFPLSKVRNLSVNRVKAFRRFGGFGIRYNFKGEVGYILSSGKLLVIDLGNEKICVSFNTVSGNLEEFISRLNAH